MNPTISGVIGPGFLNQVPTLAFIGPREGKAATRGPNPKGPRYCYGGYFPKS